MSLTLLLIISAPLLLLICVLAVGLWRSRLREQRRRDDQLYSVYKSQLRRDRKDRR